MNLLSEWTLQAISIAYDSDLAAYVVPAVGVAVLSSMSFLISVVRQWWLLREQEALLAEEWDAREEDVVGDSREVRWLFFSRVGSGPEGQRVRLKLRVRSTVISVDRATPQYLATVILAPGRMRNAIRARGILRAAQARQAIRRTRRAAATHGDDRDPSGGTLACCALRLSIELNSGMDVM